MSVTLGNAKPVVAVLFRVIIILQTLKTCSLYEFETPRLKNAMDNNDYFSYHFEPTERYEQLKLEPYFFFKSYYNPYYQTLPDPLFGFDYEMYTREIHRRKKYADINNLEKKIQEAEKKEKYKNDSRYVYKSSESYLHTNEMYYESNIYKMQLRILNKYYDSWYTLNEKEYFFIQAYYQIFRKDYENKSEFQESRLNVVLFLQEHTPNLSTKFKISNIETHINMEFNYLHTRTYLKNEDYTKYLMRINFLGGVPFHSDIIKSLYVTNVKDFDAKFYIQTWSTTDNGDDVVTPD